MEIKLLKDKINYGGFDALFAELYTENAAARVRYSDSCDRFLEIFGEKDVELFSAPGRTEVGGNHTDHQRGCVLAGSVDMDVIAVVAKNDNNIIRLKSHGYPMDTVDVTDLSVSQDEKGTSASLIRGMAAIFAENGYKIGGFDAYTTSNVLKGSGLSSSAAFEVLVGCILNHLYNDGVLDAVKIAQFAQRAECEFFGKPCGLMDQTASSVGGFTGIDFENPDSPIIEKVEFDLAKYGHSLCIVNTGGNHADLTDDYAAVPAECRAVANYFSKNYLREVCESDFYENIAALREKVGDRAVLRALHFFEDNRRAVLEKEALKKGDFERFLSLVNASGNSSFKYLQNVYSNADVTSQGISLALALTEQFLGGAGACRVHGGGFAGTIQAYVPNEMLDAYKAMINKIFGEGNCHVLKIRKYGGIMIK